MAIDAVSIAYCTMNQKIMMAAKTTAIATDTVSNAYAAMMAAKAEEEQRLMQHQHVV